jgi:predicted transcriptional regulator
MSTDTPNAHKRTDGLPDAQIHEILSNERRALALSVLQTDGPMTLRELADCLARHEYGSDYNSAERKRVYVSLYQCHLPKLEDRGVIRREDRDCGEISLTDRAPAVVWHLNNGYEQSGGGRLKALAHRFF